MTILNEHVNAINVFTTFKKGQETVRNLETT